MTRISNPQLQLRQLFGLHREIRCRSQPLASVLLLAPLVLTLLFEAVVSDFVFVLQAVDLFGVLLCELDWRGGCLVGSLSISPGHQLEARFFCALVYPVVYPELHPSASLLELVVVADHAFCVDDHPPRHQPGARTHSEVQPDLGLIDCRLITLNALGQVGLPDSVFHQGKKLSLRLFCASSRTQNAASNVNLGTHNTVNEHLDRLVYLGQACLCQPVCALRAKPVCLHTGVVVWLDEINEVPFFGSSTFVAELADPGVIVLHF